MPPTKGALWAFFYACIDLYRPASAPIPIDVDSDGEDSVSQKQLLRKEWFKKSAGIINGVVGG
jgi:hypothetical protein